MALNRLLQRQIGKHFGDKELPPEMDALIKAVSNTYDDYDRDRKMLDRSFEISSIEMIELNEALQTDIVLRKKPEEEKNLLLKVLQKSEDKFRAMFENSHVPTLLIDTSDRFLDCNEAAVRLLKGRNKSQLLHIQPAQLSAEYQPDGQRSNVKSEALNRQAFDGEPVHFEWAHMCFDGSLVIVEVSLRLVHLDSKPMLLVQWTDLTERKKIENLLHEVSEQKAHIMESIHYAERLQQASLPSLSEVNGMFLDSFVLFRPKDVISGDFYMTEIIETKSGASYHLILVGDCTGHGVPGAMLSLLFINILRQILAEKQFETPAGLLQLLSRSVKDMYRSQNDESMVDGMDVSVAFIHPDHTKLLFSNASRPIYRIRNNMLEEIKRNNCHISFSREFGAFPEYELDLQLGDTLYLFTDGYADQFGGKNYKKLMIKNFKSLLLSGHHREMKYQKAYLETYLDAWKGGIKQIDDILLIGIRV